METPHCLLSHTVTFNNADQTFLRFFLVFLSTRDCCRPDFSKNFTLDQINLRLCVEDQTVQRKMVSETPVFVYFGF